LLSALLLLGCADTPISTPELDSNSYTLIKLPPKSGLSVETAFSKTVLINGENGGEIEITENYVAPDGHTVEIYAKLSVPTNAFTGDVPITMTIDDEYFTGDVPITMTIDDEYAAVWFTPHMVFSNPVELKMSFTGIDLEELMLVNGKYDLLFIGDDGTFELVGHDEVQVIESQDEIRVQKA
jgi:hypothetical protein